VDDVRGSGAEAGTPTGGIPLTLTPLVAPYRRHGQLSIRVERLPNGARLSRGRNNGDRTWSLGLNDLDDVLYQPPQGMEEALTLAVRILSLDGDHGSTLALLDLPVSPGDARAAAAPPPTAPTAPGTASAGAGDMELRRVRDQLTELTARLAVREAELAEARHKLEQAQQGTAPKETAATDLAGTRAVWEAELREKLAVAAAEAATNLAASRQQWQTEQGGRFAELEKRADEQIQLAQQRWQQDAKAAMAQAEATWKAGEAQRLAVAEARWREESTRALAAAEARWREESTRALSEIEARAKRAEAALAELRPEEQIQRARSGWEQDSRTALAKAEELWKANEAARFAAAETRWREEQRRSLAEVESRLQQAEAALAAKAAASPQAKADEALRLAAAETRRREDAERALGEMRLRAEHAEAALEKEQHQNSGDAIEMHVLHEELREVKAALELRDVQLAQAKAAAAPERDGESDQTSKERQLADQLIADLKNNARSPEPDREKGGAGHRLLGIAMLLLIAALGVMYHPQIQTVVRHLLQRDGAPYSSSSEPSAASKAKPSIHRPSSESSRLP
jgi:DNA repair exonuclease SbcCD ATPase subunit